MIRIRLLAIFTAFLFLPLPALAERIMEVQNIRVEQTGDAGRDAAVAEATRQAATQVWQQLGRTTPLRQLTSAELQSIASYVDVANEVVRPGYYAGVFNVGIRVGALSGETAPAVGSAPAVVPTDNGPSWVLVVPARDINGTITLWTENDAWASAWQRTPSAQISTAVASADSEDQRLLSAASIQSYDPAMTDQLRALARKYGAPAAALVVLSSSRPDIGPNEEVRLDVTYVESGSPDSMTAQNNTVLTTANTSAPLAAAIEQGQALIAQLATGEGGAPPSATHSPIAPSVGPGPLPPSLTPQGQPGLSGNFANTYSAAATPAGEEQKLWIRIPLATPQDLASYRRKIESIPGARFQITALNRLYVEGNILYTGDQNRLMSELAARGLRQQ